MSVEFTAEHRQKLEEWLATHEIPAGLGSCEAACSIAAINLAISGELTASIPECMSPVIGRWIIQVQDAMHASIRNSQRWKSLLPRAAGTGRAFELERQNLVLEWLWTDVLSKIQPIADAQGFGDEWARMCRDKTQTAANAASDAAYAAYAAADAADAVYSAYAAAYAAYAAADAVYSADAADAADAAANAANAADAADEAYAAYAAANAAADAAYAAYAAANASDAADAADAAADAAYAAAYAAVNAAKANTWADFRPCDLLEKLITISEKK